MIVELCIIGFLCINLSSEKYNNLLDILCHRIVYTDYDAWYLAPLIYFIALLIALLNSWLFISIFQKPFKFSKYVGKDTLPIYISHLALYIVLTRLPLSGLWKVLFAAAATVISCVLFSCSFYTKIFNGLISKIIGLIYRESLKK